MTQWNIITQVTSKTLWPIHSARDIVMRVWAYTLYLHDGVRDVVRYRVVSCGRMRRGHVRYRGQCELGLNTLSKYSLTSKVIKYKYPAGSRSDLALFPSSMRSLMSAYDVTTSFDKSSTYGPSRGCSRTRNDLFLLFGFNRSRTCSQ